MLTINNKTFYPTPRELIRKMVARIKGSKNNALDSSAGRGDIIEYLQEESRCSHSRRFDNISAIEIDKDLRALLRGKNIKVLDSDFLTFAGPDKFDLIIANPPFNEGDKHLLKAIDIMYRGEIVFLLNAETIKNPYTNVRKLLTRKLNELNADIEYIQDAFITAERKTVVEVALIYICIDRKVEDDLFNDVDDMAEDLRPEIDKNYEVSNRKTIQEMVAEYNQIVNIGIQTITEYYRNYRKIGEFIGLNQKAENGYSDGDMTSKMQREVNAVVRAIRVNFWRKTLDLREVQSRMTAKKQREFEESLKTRCDMDFTENNIRQFVLNLIGGYTQTLTEAVVEIFDKFTQKHCYGQLPDEKNIHYFNGWKTNKAFKVNKKVIIPLYGGWGGGPFIGYSGEWRLDYSVKRELLDIDVVMNYFDGCPHYDSICNAVERAFNYGQSRKIYSTYFEITCYKKGTIHLVFRDNDILRRFNVAACMGKKWLPFDYGQKSYEDLDVEKKEIVESFEGKSLYNKHLNRPIFAENPSRIKIAA